MLLEVVKARLNVKTFIAMAFGNESDKLEA
jgi:hypothetical protein